MTIKRSKWKGILFTKKNFDNLKNFSNRNKIILIFNRSSMITPICINRSFKIFNGKNFTKLNVTEQMIGHKFGEFSLTRKRHVFKKKKKKKKKMGQKVNSNIFQLSFNTKNKKYKSKYTEKNPKELSFIIYQDIEIIKYIKQFFKLYGLIVNDTKISRSNTDMIIFISYFNSLESVLIVDKFYKTNFKFLLKKFKINNTLMIESIKKTFYRKKYKRKVFFITENFINKLIVSLNRFLGLKYRVRIVLQNLNKGSSIRLKNSNAVEFRSSIIKLRSYYKSNFFKEIINILIFMLKKKNSATLISTYIATQLSKLKRHNYFLNFLKRLFKIIIQLKFSGLSGIKLRINGRFNGASRSKTKLIQIGTIPLQSFNSKISYNESTSYTSNGTFGVNIWICEK